MKKFTICFFLLTFYNNWVSADCVEANSSANYALLHTKKSVGADNFDHQRYFADRAIDAFLKTKKSMDSCGCDDALSAIENALISLRKASSPEDWEKGRFYAKRALEDANAMMDALDACTTGNIGTSNYSITSTPMSSSVSASQQNLIAEQKRLEDQQKRLVEEQKRLQEQMAEQQKMQEQINSARQREFEQQLFLKSNAELAISNYERALNELLMAMECTSAKKILAGDYKKSEEALKSESLTDTKRFYYEKIMALQRDAINNLQQGGCN